MPIGRIAGLADMKEAAKQGGLGITLVTLTALPLVLVIAGWVMWMDHAYTLGLSLRAERGLAALLMADIVCLSVGLYFDCSKSSSRTN